jgi:alpha-tubulin suppressor-like RCC1 family protein/chitodextrinase
MLVKFMCAKGLASIACGILVLLTTLARAEDGTGTGLTAQYFRTKDLSGVPTLERTDARVNFDWAGGAPDATMPADNFSVRWQGFIQPRYNEAYTLVASTDDGVRVWLDGQLVIDAWVPRVVTDSRYTFTATAGHKYAIRMQYFEQGGSAVAKLSWLSEHESYQPVPTTQLYPLLVDLSAIPALLNGTGTGLAAQYFRTKDLSGVPTLERTDAQVNFDWAGGAPAASMPADNFSVRWQGFIQPRYSEAYTLVASADDGVRVWLDDVVVIDSWKAQNLTDLYYTFTAQAGRRYGIRMEYFEQGGSAVAKLSWLSVHEPYQPIPTTQLYPSSEIPVRLSGTGTGLTAQYFRTMDLSGVPALARTDAQVNFDWAGGAPAASLPADNFSVRWQGFIQPRFSEMYTLVTTTDDGVRVWLDDTLVIDDWGPHVAKDSLYRFNAEEGRQYAIRMDYYERGGSAVAKLKWSSLHEPYQPVPVTQLYPNLRKPVIAWTPTCHLSVGSPLSAAQFNATTSVPGAFVYTPAVGTVLPQGVHRIQSVFTPTDPAYAPVTTMRLVSMDPVGSWFPIGDLGKQASYPNMSHVCQIAVSDMVGGYNVGSWNSPLMVAVTDAGRVEILSADPSSYEFLDDPRVVWSPNVHELFAEIESLTDVVQVTTGGFWLQALLSDGSVVGWPDITDPAAFFAEKNVVAIAENGRQAAVIRSNGTVDVIPDGESSAKRPWVLQNISAIALSMYDDFGLTEDGLVVGWSAPLVVGPSIPSDLKPVTSIATGDYHALALQNDGTVAAWGSTALGSNNPQKGQATVPSGLDHVVAVAAGSSHSLALKADGTVVGWGAVRGDYVDSTSAVTYNPLVIPAELRGVTAIQAGGRYSMVCASARVPVQVSLSNLTSIYTGQPVAMTATCDQGLTVTALTYNGSPTPPTAPGIYTVRAVADYWGYYGEATATLTITAPSPVITTITPASGPVAGGTSVIIYGTNLANPTSVTFDGVSATVVSSTATQIVVTTPAHAAGLANVVVSTASGSMTRMGGFAYVAPTDLWMPVGVPAYTPTTVCDVRAIGAGISYMVALKTDGTVVAWGNNAHGQITIPAGLTGVTAIAAGPIHTVALKSDGTVVAWGSNGDGQTTIPVGLTGVTAIAAGDYHTVVLKADGTVVAWGWNGYGQTTIPAGLTGVTAIAAGRNHTVALKNDGTVVAWGNNAHGQTTIPAGLTGVTAIAAGGDYTVALKGDGTVVAWGFNDFGQMTIPTGLTGVTAIAASDIYGFALKTDGTVVAWGDSSNGPLTIPAGLTGVTAIAARGYQVVALKGDGTVVAWSNNYFIQTMISADLTGVTAIAEGVNHTVALKNDGTVVAWGWNGYGQTTIPAGLTGVTAIAVGAYHTVALKTDGTVVAWGQIGYGQTTIPAGLTGVIAIAAGREHTVALKADGTVAAWGRNDYGQTTIPMGLTGVTAIAASNDYTVALKNDGTVVAWGDNTYGQTAIPAGLTGVTAIAAGDYHTVALKSDGTVVAWGWNNYGQTTIPADLTGVTAIAAGGFKTVALKTDGTVVAWGTNDFGQSTPPVGLTGVTAIASGTWIWIRCASKLPVAVSVVSKTHAFTGQPIRAQTTCDAGFYVDYVTYNGSLTPPTEPGVYTVRAVVDRWSYHGEAVGTLAIINGGVAPTISTQPSSVSVIKGQTATFSVTASGFPAPAYQWRRNDVNIVGATNPSYTTPVTAEADNGSAYVCVVTNALGSVTSSAATLTITAPLSPIITTITPASGPVTGGTSVAISGTNLANPTSVTFDGVSAIVVSSTTTQIVVTAPAHAAGLTNVVVSTASGSMTRMGGFAYVESTDIWMPVGPSAYAPTVVCDVRAIAAGGGYTVALKNDGTVVAWGDNSYGQTTIPAGLTGVTAIAAGNSHTVALKNDGTVVAWGDNSSGQTTVPAGLTGVTAIAAGNSHTVALKNDGTVVAWGSDSSGETTVPSGLTGVTAIAAGYGHTVALKNDGTVVAWGDNSFGQTTIPSDLTDARAITANNGYTIALKSDGTVVAWGWGGGGYGQTMIPSDLTDVTAIAAGGMNAVALKSDGTVVPWGNYFSDPTTIPSGLTGVTAIAAGYSHMVALKSDGTVVAWGENYSGETTIPYDLTGVTAIAVGNFHTLALRSDGTVVGWGGNSSGEMTIPSGLTGVTAIAAEYFRALALKSDGTVVGWGIPVLDPMATMPTGLTDVMAIAAGSFHTVALKSDGTVVGWNIPDYGDNAGPVPVGLAGVVAIAAGGDRTVVLKSDGTVVGWGDDRFGQTTIPSGLTGVVAIAASGSHTVALKNDGTVVAWGDNSSGQTTIPAGLTGVTAIAAGFSHTVALKNDGTVVAWGNNLYGQTTIPPNLTGVTSISAGSDATWVRRSSKLPVSISVVSETRDFTGQPIRAQATCDAGFFVDYVTYNGSLTPPTEPGVYTVRAVVDRWSYHGEATGVLTIQDATIIPTVTTGDISALTSSSAVSGGNVDASGDSPVTARGVCWSTTTNPTIANSKTSDGAGAGAFTSVITGLSANTTYHVRAYAINAVGTAYGADVVFTTLAGPTIVSLSPTSGTTDGGTSVTITGTNLTGTTVVTFGGAAATAVTAVNATIVTCVTPAKAAGTVDVILTTPGGQATKMASYMYVTGTAPPLVITQPDDKTVAVGSTATFTIVASGSASLSYQWWRSDDGGVNWAAVSGATLATYSISATAVDTGAQFRCTVVNGVGSATSIAAILTVLSSIPDDTAPSIPGAPTVVTTSGSSVSIQWTASTDNIGIVGYEIEQSGEGIEPFIVSQIPATVTFTDTGLKMGTTYDYRVRAFDAAGNRSPWSGTLVASTASVDTTPPSLPIGLTVTGRTRSAISLSWKPSVDDVAMQDYVIFRGAAQIGTSGTTSFIDHGLQVATSYTYTVKARDLAGNLSDASLSVSTTTPAGIPSPANLGLLTRTDNSLAISWNPVSDPLGPPVSGYDIFVDGSFKLSVGADSHATISGLNTERLYTITLVTRDSNGDRSVASIPFTVMTSDDVTAPGAPGTPTLISSTMTTVTLQWTAATDNVGVVGYDILRSGYCVGQTTSGLTFTESGLSPGTNYYYQVRAYDAVGNRSSPSDYSANMMTLADTIKPSIPTNLTVTGSTASSVSLRWTASTDNVGIQNYEIRCSGYSQISTTTGTTFTVTGLVPSTSYSFTVTARDLANNVSAASSPVAMVTPADTTAPTIPGAPYAPYAVVNFTSAYLVWAPSADNVAVSLYTLYRDGTEVFSGDSTSYNDNDLVSGTTYTYTVTARDAAGNVSAASSGGIVTTPADTVAPLPPTDIFLDTRSSTSLGIRWMPGTDPYGIITGYEVYLDGVLTTTVGDVSSTVINGLLATQSYTITMKTVDGGGNRSVMSLPLVVAMTSLGDVTAPTIPGTPTMVSSTMTTVRLQWTAATDNVGVVGYDILRNGHCVGQVTFGLTFTDSGLSPGTNYYYEVRAYDAAGNRSSPSDYSTNMMTLADAIKPGIPTGLTVTGSTASSVSLGWMASTDNVGIQYYVIQRSGYGQIGTTTGTTFTVTGLEPNTSYSFTVTARDLANNVSAASSPVAMVTPADTTAPTIPGTPYAPNAVDFTSAYLVWAPSTDNVAVSSYTILRNGVPVFSGNSTDYFDNGLASGTSYTYTVTARDEAGNISAASGGCTITTPADTVAPLPPTDIVLYTRSDTSLGIRWMPGTDPYGIITGYEVYLDGVLTTTVGDVSSTVINGLLATRSYTITMKTVDGGGNRSVMSLPLVAMTSGSVTEPSVPGTPTLISSTMTTVTLEWTAATDSVGVVGYEVLRDGDCVGQVTSGLTFTDSGLSPGSDYYYQVRAYDTAGNRSSPSDYSANMTTLPDMVNPASPTNVAMTAITTDSVSLTWEASTDNVGIKNYQVFRGDTQVGAPVDASYVDKGLSISADIIYTIKAVDLAGNTSEGSSISLKPTISIQPVNQTVLEGWAANFSLDVLGLVGVDYQWYRSDDGGNTWVSIDGAIAKDYHLPVAQIGDTGAQFRCVVTNAAGTTNSTAVTLTVQAIAPVIVSELMDRSAVAWTTTTFAIDAIGSGPLTYQWSRSNDGGVTWIRIPGATSASYDLSVGFGDNLANFRCGIANSGGVIFSRAALLTVQALPTNGVAARWKFESLTGGITPDVSGNGNAGILQNGPTQIAGQFGNAIHLNGVNQYLSTANQQTNPQEFTMALWFRTSQAGGVIMDFSDSHYGASVNADRILYINNAGCLVFGVWNGSAVTIVSPEVVNTNTWHHAAAVISGMGMELYLDGIRVAQNASVTTAQNVNGWWHLGYDTMTRWPAPGADFFNGDLDEVVVYNRAMQTDEVSALIAGGMEFSTFVGFPGDQGMANGLGLSARFANPNGLAVDTAGNVYVADTNNHMIRKVTSAGQVTTLAGMAGIPGSANGNGTNAQFNGPTGVAVDRSGNVFVADQFNQTIRKIAPNGDVTTVAGTDGVPGNVDGDGASAQFNYPTGIAVDATGNLFVTDQFNCSIRKITPGPTYMVSTLAGSGSPGFADGAGAAAQFNYPTGIAISSVGTLYVTDTYNQVIRIVSSDGAVLTFAGVVGQAGSINGERLVAQFNYPSGITVANDGSIYVADTGNCTIRAISITGEVNTYAGSEGAAGSQDGFGAAASFNYPAGIVIDATGIIYVIDTGNQTLRKGAAEVPTAPVAPG